MTLLLMDGGGNLPNLRAGQTGPNGAAPQVGRDGVGNAISGGASGTVTYALPFAASRVFVGLAQRVVSSQFGQNSISNVCLTLLGDGGATSHLSVNFDASGHIQLRRGSSSAAVIAVGTNVPPTNATWHYIEVEATIADAGGICNVWLDGAQVITFSGDTKNAGTNTTVDAILTAAGSGLYCDDLYVCDDVGSAPYNTRLGDITIRESRSTGNGASSQFVGSDGNSTDNYLLTNEKPYNTSDYVGSATAGHRDLYDFADIAGATTVLATQVHAYAQKTDAGARSIKTLTRSTTPTVVASSALPLSTTFAVLSGNIRTTDADGSALTQALVNSAQFGVEVV